MRSNHPHFVAPGPAIEERVQALLDQMTFDEKVRLLGGKREAGSTYEVERLGIPALRFADGPMGVHWWCDAATAYPAVIAAAATWDRDLWYALGQALGRDCRARGVHVLLAPGVNLYRSPLCGRNFEYAGEDPFLSSRFAVGYITGLQDRGVSATVKHFACNFQEYERHHTSSDVDERTLHETYLPAFQAAIEEAGSGALMCAYNRVNGVQASESLELIADTLKGRWSFDGLVMSDWISTYSTVDAANAGLDLEMPEALWFTRERLQQALARGQVAQEVLDDKVRRLLRLAACFGWLDHPQQDPHIPLRDPETEAVALQLARAGCVLLKNDRDTLPLDATKLRKLAVLGFGAHPANISGGGSAHATPFEAVSVLQGLRQLLGPGVELLHASGPAASQDGDVYDSSHFESELGRGLKAEYFDNNGLEGEPTVVRLDPQVNFFWHNRAPAEGISVRQYSVRWSGTLTPQRSAEHELFSRCRNGHYRIWLDGEVLIDTWARERNGMHRVVRTLTAGRAYRVQIEWRKTRVSGNMKFGWRPVADPARGLESCVRAAEQAEAAVVCVGFDRITESEGYDREFAMHPGLERLIQEVARVQPNTVVVLMAGGNVDMNRWIDGVPALLHAWYPGQEGGRAIAGLLLGHCNPSGRLPASFERRLDDRSSSDCYHDDLGTGRVQLRDGIFGGYRGLERAGIEPRFPFGFGLSYTRFEYRKVRLLTPTLAAGQALEIELEVKNVGDRPGGQVVQLYVGQLQPSVPRPLKELCAFGKVCLLPHQSRMLRLSVPHEQLGFYSTARKRRQTESGRYRLFLGDNVRDIHYQADFLIG